MHLRHILLIPWLAVAAGVQASGQFDVDDAGMLDPGQCQYELWATRPSGENGTPWHIGPSCRIGPVELGLTFDRVLEDGRRATLVGGPQLKWTFYGQAPDAPVAAALSLATVFASQGGRAGGQFVVPLTWHAADSLRANLNVGVDRSPLSGTSTPRRGVGGEWKLSEVVSLIAERNKAGGLWTSRIGARLGLTPTISVEFSAARSGPDHVRVYAIGLNHEFGR